MTTSTAYTITNDGIGQLIGYVSSVLTTGTLLIAIIGITVLYGAIRWIKRASHPRI